MVDNKLMTLTANEFLSIVAPEELFTKEDLDKTYKEFAKRWHPDVSNDPKSNDVFIHIDILYKEAKRKIKEGVWGYSGVLHITDKSGTKFKVKYNYSEMFELGMMYISNTTICYVLDEKYERFFNNGIKIIKSLKVPSKDNADTLEKTLPKIKKVIEADDGKHILVLEKTLDIVPLKVALNYFGGKFEPKVAAWMIGCLHNTLCFLKYNLLTHNDISTSTYFISPKHHTGLLLGGWWYATKIGSKLIGASERTYSMMSLSQKQKRMADPYLDAELLRCTARELLGDVSGFKLKSLGVPLIMDQWVNVPSIKDAYSDYKRWEEVLTKAFGPRKFIPMDMNISKAYNMMPRGL